MQQTESINDYEYDDDLGRDLRVWLVIKGFNQLAIVQKIIERNGSKAYGLTATTNVSERKYSNGQIVLTDLNLDHFDKKTLATSTLRISCIEPFDLAIHDACVAYTSGYQISIRELTTGIEKTLAADWMSFLHSVQFSSDGSRVLTASAGFDTLLEIEVESGMVVWEWNTWDHGFNYSEIGKVYITRDKNRLPTLVDRSATLIVVSSPRDWPKEGIPTHQSPTRLNGASYDGNDLMLVTCFHRPELFRIKRDGSFEAANLGLSHPHGFFRSNLAHHDGYLVTNTGAGELLLLDEALTITHRWIFSGLSANDSKKRGFGEWIQNVVPLKPAAGIVAAIDALRDGTHILDLQKKRRRFIPNPPEWTLQKLMTAE
jgi:hypothetical protein